MKPDFSDTETTRLNALRTLHLMDSQPDTLFDELTQLASMILEMPIALCTIVDEKRVWFRSHVGLELSETQRGSWFCESAIQQEEVLEVSDATTDERFKDHLLVASAPKIRFYAGAPIRLKDGSRVGTLCVLDTKPGNLTLRQKGTLKMLSSIVAEHLDSQRLLASLEEELRKSRQLADSASTMKSLFLGNMSHELRTPMTAVLGMTDLLLSTELKSDQREFLHTIRSSGESLLNILNSILDYSKIESGSFELDAQPLDVRALIEETLDLVSPKARERGNEVVYVIGSAVPARIVGDVARLRQILVNLIDNATKFTHDGEIFLSLNARRVAGDEFELTFSVRDTGIGIPKDKLESIFLAFTQADPSVTRKYGGTGLGLVICSRLVGMMGGTIGVESSEGKGSKFIFSLRATAVPATTPVAAPETKTNISGKRVLLVDDNATNLQILSEESKQWGMVPISVGSPAEALELLKKGDRFDVAIYDMQMPEMDGIHLAVETRKLYKPELLPIVLLSSWDLDDPRIRENSRLFAAVVMKPLKISSFESLLSRVIGSPGSIATTVSPRPNNNQLLASEIPISIMVAEDNSINQKLIQRMLRGMGYQAVLVDTGLEALNALESIPCDLIFMDVQMPEMDGLEATQKIRQRYGKGKGPAIVAMTAFALSGDKEKCLRAGMDDYLSKPFDSSQVESMIRKWGAGKSKAGDGHAENTAGSGESVDAGLLARLAELEHETAPSFVKELIEIYLQEVPSSLMLLRKAFLAKDRIAFEQVAHKLRGSSLNLGAGELSNLLGRAEESARDNLASVPESLIAGIEIQCEKTLAYLRTRNALT